MASVTVSVVHAFARATRRSPSMSKQSASIRQSRSSRHTSHRVSASTSPVDIKSDKQAHNEELKHTRDAMVGGCSECEMPFENERATVLAGKVMVGHSRLVEMEAESNSSTKMSLRVLVIGAETGKLVKELLNQGATHVLVIDHSQKMLDRAAEQFDALGVSGNESGARFLQADVSDVPAYQGPFDAVVFNDTLSKEFDAKDSLGRTLLLTRPGARVVVSEREGEEGDETTQLDVDQLVLDLPAQRLDSNPELGKTMASEAELETKSDKALDHLDLTCSSRIWTYEVPPLFSLRNTINLTAPVVTGFGRGSKLMGVPTANLDPEVLSEQLDRMRKGVYFGYARLSGDVKHQKWCKCVVNVGQRPTFADGKGVTVEVHALRDFGRDFYGETMSVSVLGFIRPEMWFDGFQQLVARIFADIGLAKNFLGDDRCRERVDQSVGFAADE